MLKCGKIKTSVKYKPLELETWGLVLHNQELAKFLVKHTVYLTNG